MQSPLIECLKKVALFSPVTNSWRSVSDWIIIIGKVYNIPDTLTNILTTRLINSILNSTLPIVDNLELGLNKTGIFRRRNGNKLYIYVCKPGEGPSQCQSGAMWHNFFSGTDRSTLWCFEFCVICIIVENLDAPKLEEEEDSLDNYDEEEKEEEIA